MSLHGNFELLMQEKWKFQQLFHSKDFLFHGVFIVVYQIIIQSKSLFTVVWGFTEGMGISLESSFRTWRFSIRQEYLKYPFFRFLVLVIYVNSSLPGRFKSVVHNRSDYTSSSCLEKLEFITTKTFLQSFFSFLVFSNLI